MTHKGEVEIGVCAHVIRSLFGDCFDLIDDANTSALTGTSARLLGAANGTGIASGVGHDLKLPSAAEP